MKLNVEALLRRFQKAKTHRDQFASMWQDIYDYTMPSRQGFYSMTVGDERSEIIYDETALVALDDFTSAMQQGMTPQFEQWFRLEPGEDIPDAARGRMQSELDEVGRYIWEMIAASNFGTEGQEVYTDMGLGWSCQLIEEGRDASPLKFKTIPQCHSYFDSGPFGSVDGVFRVRNNVKISEIRTLYPKAKLSDTLQGKMQGNPDATTNLVEATYRDWDVQETETYCYQVVETEGKTLLIEEEFRGEGSKPFITPRWSVAAGEAYGRGPLVRALPAIRTVNLVTEMILENAQMAISGIWQIEDDGSINTDTVEIVPGALYPKGPDSAGLENIAQAGNFNVADLIIANQQENIRRALFAEDSGGDISKTPRSALEVGDRRRRLANRIGGSFGRMIYEYSDPVVRRVVYLLKKQGKLELPKLDGREIKIVSRSPLARAQRLDDIDRLRGFVSDLAAMLGDPRLLPAYVDDERLASELQQSYEVPYDLLRTRDDREEKLGAIMSAMQEQPGAESA